MDLSDTLTKKLPRKFGDGWKDRDFAYEQREMKSELTVSDWKLLAPPDVELSGKKAPWGKRGLAGSPNKPLLRELTDGQ